MLDEAGREEGILDAVVRKTKHELGLELSKVELMQTGRVLYASAHDSLYGEHECKQYNAM